MYESTAITVAEKMECVRVDHDFVPLRKPAISVWGERGVSEHCFVGKEAREVGLWWWWWW